MDSPMKKSDGAAQQSTGATPPQPSEIAGFQKIYPNERDDNLPEVYVDDTPQVLPESEAHRAETFSDATSPKFSVADTLKTPVDPGHEVAGDRPPGGYSEKENASTKERRICGLRRKWFFVVLGVILVIVIAAAVGGGVGGAVASSASGNDNSDSDASENDEKPSSTPTPTPTTLSSSTTTSSATSTPSPTFLNNQTTPQDTFGFQGFSDTSYDGSATDIIHDEGGTEFDFNVTSYVWLPDDTGCCISFCLNETMEGMVGWRCGSRYQEESSDDFGRIYVWCGERQVKESARCGDIE